MPYNNFFPATYQGVQYQPQMPQYQPQYQQQMNSFQNNPPPQVQPQDNCIQSVYIRVPSEEVARNYRVMPGSSTTFIDDNRPYCYVKSLGMSQFDIPTFEKYRLIKEDESPENAQNDNLSNDNEKSIDLSGYVTTAQYDALRADFAEQIASLTAAVSKLKGDIDILNNPRTMPIVRKDDNDNE